MTGVPNIREENLSIGYLAKADSRKRKHIDYIIPEQYCPETGSITEFRNTARPLRHYV